MFYPSLFLSGRSGHCRTGATCTIGKRLARHRLTGALWSLLSKLEPILQNKLQRMECKNEHEAVLIGIDIPATAVEMVRDILTNEAEESVCIRV